MGGSRVLASGDVMQVVCSEETKGAVKFLTIIRN